MKPLSYKWKMGLIGWVMGVMAVMSITIASAGHTIASHDHTTTLLQIESTIGVIGGCLLGGLAGRSRNSGNG